MNARGGRHRRRGPGGPRRPERSGRTTPPRHRHRPDVSGVLDPTLDSLVATLLETAHRAAPASHPGRAPALELWAAELARSSYDDEAMPGEFYVDLAGALERSPDPLAPAVLAALAEAIDHDDAAPLRRAREAWLERTASPGPADLGIGAARAVRAAALDAVGEAQVSLVLGVAQGGAAHSIGLLVDGDLDGAARDLWVGPPIEEVLDRARADGDILITDVPLAEARARAREALERAVDDDVLGDEDLLLLPLLLRRLEPDET